MKILPKALSRSKKLNAKAGPRLKSKVKASARERNKPNRGTTATASAASTHLAELFSEAIVRDSEARKCRDLQEEAHELEIALDLGVLGLRMMQSHLHPVTPEALVNELDRIKGNIVASACHDGRWYNSRLRSAEDVETPLARSREVDEIHSHCQREWDARNATTQLLLETASSKLQSESSPASLKSETVASENRFLASVVTAQEALLKFEAELRDEVKRPGFAGVKELWQRDVVSSPTVLGPGRDLCSKQVQERLIFNSSSDATSLKALLAQLVAGVKDSAFLRGYFSARKHYELGLILRDCLVASEIHYTLSAFRTMLQPEAFVTHIETGDIFESIPALREEVEVAPHPSVRVEVGVCNSLLNLRKPPPILVESAGDAYGPDTRFKISFEPHEIQYPCYTQSEEFMRHKAAALACGPVGRSTASLRNTCLRCGRSGMRVSAFPTCETNEPNPPSTLKTKKRTKPANEMKVRKLDSNPNRRKVERRRAPVETRPAPPVASRPNDHPLFHGVALCHDCLMLYHENREDEDCEEDCASKKSGAARRSRSLEEEAAAAAPAVQCRLCGRGGESRCPMAMCCGCSKGYCVHCLEILGGEDLVKRMLLSGSRVPADGAPGERRGKDPNQPSPSCPACHPLPHIAPRAEGESLNALQSGSSVVPNPFAFRQYSVSDVEKLEKEKSALIQQYMACSGQLRTSGQRLSRATVRRMPPHEVKFRCMFSKVNNLNARWIHHANSQVMSNSSTPNRGIRVLSLFDGIGGALCALKRIGVRVDVYFVCEIHPQAIKIVKANHGHDTNLVFLGDVYDLTEEKIRNQVGYVDLVVGGPPCQDFSRANINRAKEKATCEMCGDAGSLTPEFARVLSTIKASLNPHVLFLYENVAMSKGVLRKTESVLGAKTLRLDAANWSAGHRNRVYATNLPFRYEGQSASTRQSIWEPKDVQLVDILEREVFPPAGEEHDPSEFMPLDPSRLTRSKAICIRTKNTGNGKLNGRSWPMSAERYESDYWVAKSINMIPVGTGSMRGLMVKEVERILGFPVGYMSREGGPHMQERDKWHLLGNSFSISTLSRILSPLRVSYAAWSQRELMPGEDVTEVELFTFRDDAHRRREGEALRRQVREMYWHMPA